MNRKDFRKAIREARVARGWTLERAATELGISRQALNYLERGLTKPRARTRARLLAVYELEEQIA